LFIESVDKIKIHYTTEGNNNDDNVSLVFIHGWGGYLDIWKYQKVLDKKFKLVFIDLAGHGKSDKTRKNLTMQLFAEDVKLVIENLNLKKIIIIGWSMGGAIMLETAKLLPQKVIGLIGIDCLERKSEIANPSTWIRRDDEFISQIKQYFSDNFQEKFTNFYKSFLTEKISSNDISELIKNIEKSDQQSILSCSENMLKWDYRDIINDIKIPIRCIMAGNYYKSMERKEEAIDFPAIFMDDVKHMMFWEEPEKFNGILEDQIQRILG
jgi:pimeloyl-ACP methyl ester carboxylesterase